jgi:ATP-dependent Clp protease ATP-binding subunit ClpA
MEISKLAIADGDVSARGITEAARRYRVGLTENPWQKEELRNRIYEGHSRLRKRVKGQDKAISRALTILTKSSLNLTSLHSSAGVSGPRGVLFFAGGTGVGKTELAKALAELIFGKEEAMIRFDMSEFSHPAAEARLIGAPPGYVGHGAGGELTNAVRTKPFAVILFDEIEKADGSILDKFLQILSDGRLTDGSGDTVYFKETIIIFTSNLGASEVKDMAIEDDESLLRYESAIHGSVSDYFTKQLKRPELLGRMGGEKNIVVFRPITPKVAAEIAQGSIDNILRGLALQANKAVSITDRARGQAVGLASGESVQILSGLREGEQIVLPRSGSNLLGAMIRNSRPGGGGAQ